MTTDPGTTNEPLTDERLEEIRAKLTENELSFSWRLADDRLHLFFVTSEGVKSYFVGEPEGAEMLAGMLTRAAEEWRALRKQEPPK